jgi:hypothetical protein
LALPGICAHRHQRKKGVIYPVEENVLGPRTQLRLVHPNGCAEELRRGLANTQSQGSRRATPARNEKSPARLLSGILFLSLEAQLTRQLAVFADPECLYCQELETRLEKLDDVTGRRSAGLSSAERFDRLLAGQ